MTNLAGHPADVVESLQSTYGDQPGIKAIVWDGAQAIVVVEARRLVDWRSRLTPLGIPVAPSCVEAGLEPIVDAAMTLATRSVPKPDRIISWGYDGLRDAIVVTGVDQETLLSGIGAISEEGRSAALAAITDGTLRIDPSANPSTR